MGIETYHAFNVKQEGVYVKEYITDSKWSEDCFKFRITPTTPNNLRMNPEPIPDKGLSANSIKAINRSFKFMDSSSAVFWRNLIAKSPSQDANDSTSDEE